jgi:succinyl-diaminopimelate desuccinylase
VTDRPAARTAAVRDDTLRLARRLIECRSITPSDGGSLDLVAARLTAAGFVCERIDRGVVRNLWARHGTAPPLVCLAGHVDVVPPGPADAWTSDPFSAVEREGRLYGRGAADMKTSVAAMVTAAERLAAAGAGQGSLALLLTSDEEGDAVDGTAAVVEALHRRGVVIDACIIGEPTSTARLGDTVKNGRRGSLSGVLTVNGSQCHIAYPERGRNPIHQAIPALAELLAAEWDQGNEHFQPTSFQISSVEAGAGASNVIPGVLQVRFNFRFSPASSDETLKTRVHQILDRQALDYELRWTLSGRPFMTGRGPLVEALSAAIESVTGAVPELSTGGGTSDGRFLADISREVIEFGPVHASIHAVDEHVSLDDIAPLSLIYEGASARLLGNAVSAQGAQTPSRRDA